MCFALTLRLCSALNRGMKEKQDKPGGPRLAEIEDIDEVREKEGFTFSVRGVIGQLRPLWGSDYQWTSEDIVPLSPCHKG